jgi:dihydropteroate synthase
MGILNVTPDSFSDGGMYIGTPDAVCRAREMIEQGADIIDVGGESSRPGSTPVSIKEQLARVIPVIESIGYYTYSARNCLISVDTTQGMVAEAALEAGAEIVNDISAGLADPEMFKIVAKRGAYIVLMHMLGTPETMQENPVYKDVVSEVLRFLEDRTKKAIAAGIYRDRILIDPGIGFGKRKQDNLRLLAALEQFVRLGFPVVLGTSRKRFMGSVCGESQPTDLLGATVATTVVGMIKGVSVFRVHDVRANRQAVDVISAIHACERSFAD